MKPFKKFVQKIELATLSSLLFVANASQFCYVTCKIITLC